MPTAPAAKAALLGLLEPAFAVLSPSVPVFWGQPPSVSSPDWVFLGNVTGTQQVVSLGPQLPREEDYDLEVNVLCTRGAESQRLASERAYALANVVQATLFANPTLQGAVRVAQLVRLELDESKPDGEHRLATLTLIVNCQARVQGV